MNSVWDSKSFATAWNETYGLDMAKAPIRPGLIYPLIGEATTFSDDVKLVDFGCGNGNLIRHFRNLPFKTWLGIDGGSAILDTALELKHNNPRIDFRLADLGKPLAMPLSGYDVATSVFVIEEIPAQNIQTFFNTLASALKPKTGRAHIFTQHPTYAFKEDFAALQAQTPNTKFAGHQGYFDTNPSTYALSVLNTEEGHPERAAYHHKPMSMILNACSKAGLQLEVMNEVPSGIITLQDLRSHTPKCGDIPRFLHLQMTRI